jgi:hypothetical protein
MSSIKISIFFSLIFLLALTSCSPVVTESAENTKSPGLVSKVPTQLIPTNTYQPSPVTPTATSQVLKPIPTSPSTGTLVIEFIYTGQWYRETFNYQPIAPNIRHMVLVMPEESDIILASPGWVFSNLMFTQYPEPFTFRPEVTEYLPLLKYLYDAPGGLVAIDLPPGRYKVAVAFIAAPLPPPNEDAILYAGVTGGGASNEFRVFEVLAGEITHVSLELTDKNGWGWLNTLALK